MEIHRTERRPRYRVLDENGVRQRQTASTLRFILRSIGENECIKTTSRHRERVIRITRIHKREIVYENKKIV